MLKDLMKMDLQYFAENPEDNPEDDPAASTEDDQGEGSAGESKKEESIEFTDEQQKHINNIIEKRLARQEKEYQEKIKKEREKAKADAERYAQMTEKEKEQAELEERLKELEERERELNNRELLANIQSDLQEKRLPLAFADMLLTLQDNEKIKQSIEEISEVWNEEIAEAKKASVRQPDPKDSTSSYGVERKGSKADFFNEGRKI